MLRVLVVVALSSACAAQVTFDTPVPDDGTFPLATPSAVALARYQRAAEYSRSKKGLSVLVLEGGNVVFEEHQNGNTESTPHHLFSGTKSFSCALAVSLAADGTLDLDERASTVLTSWAGDPARAPVTVRQLLSFTSGLQDDFLTLTRDGLLAAPRVADKYAFAVALPSTHAPGTYYEYSSTHLMAFGAFVKAKTGRDPLDLLEERVFAKLGMRFGGWIHDPAGNAALPYGAFTTAREWAKFGVMVRDGGAFRGTQVLEASRLAECFTGSEPLPAYGLTWWLNKPVPAEKLAVADAPIETTDGEGGPLFYADAPDDLAVAAGYNDQRLYVMPSKDLVVVRLGQGGGWSDAAFLSRLLGGDPRE